MTIETLPGIHRRSSLDEEIFSYKEWQITIGRPIAKNWEQINKFVEIKINRDQQKIWFCPTEKHSESTIKVGPPKKKGERAFSSESLKKAGISFGSISVEWDESANGWVGDFPAKFNEALTDGPADSPVAENDDLQQI